MKLNSSKSVALVVALAAVVLLASGSSVNQITTLPGWDNSVNLTMYTGYVTVSESHNRNIFYWLVESTNSPSTDPLVVWFQGGPGCSGLGGLFTENGPFTVDLEGKLQYNPFSWTSVANMLWIEQPAGVGFSYSEDKKDYRTNDTRAADDNYTFLQGFLELFPQYNGRDLWLTGESYGGIYVPDLSTKIILGDDQSLAQQFKGFMIGNPLNVCEENNYYSNSIQFNIFYYHGLVSQTNYAVWVQNNCDLVPDQKVCKETLDKATKEIGVIYQQLKEEEAVDEKEEPSLDPDNLYQDFCTGNGTLEFAIDNPKNCSPVGDRVQAYLNRADVQQAIAARPAKWVECTNNIDYVIYEELLYMNPNFELAMKAGVNVLVYSGDVDVATVPMWFTTPCLNALNRTEIEHWKPWFVNGATAGYVQVFDGYTFATIKGAGHEAPQYQPLIAFNMFSRFLTTQSLKTVDAKASTAERQRIRKALKQSDMLRRYKLVNY